jgi:hypothetical protein
MLIKLQPLKPDRLTGREKNNEFYGKNSSPGRSSSGISLRNLSIKSAG